MARAVHARTLRDRHQFSRRAAAVSRGIGRAVTGHGGFLDSDLAPEDYLATIEEDAYAGFNLIVGTAGEVAYLSNREAGMRISRARNVWPQQCIARRPLAQGRTSKASCRRSIADKTLMRPA